jgi:hypothetical protein
MYCFVQIFLVCFIFVICLRIILLNNSTLFFVTRFKIAFIIIFRLIPVYIFDSSLFFLHSLLHIRSPSLWLYLLLASGLRCQLFLALPKPPEFFNYALLNLIETILLFIYAFEHLILLFSTALSWFCISDLDLELFLILKWLIGYLILPFFEGPST